MAIRGVAAYGLIVSLLACTADEPTAPAAINTEVMAAEATPQPSNMVDLTVYYRNGRGADAYLTPVVREVPVADAQPRRVMELLLKGPERRDPGRLQPVLPTTTRLRGISVRAGTATVMLSRHAVADARTVGKQPKHEALALAAVANTLTEFPVVRRVRLHIEGNSKQKFWGFWGLPPVLIRDESLIDPQRGDPWPRVDGFTHRPQHVGVRHRRRQPAIAAVRVQSLTTYTRLTVEVTAADGSHLRGPVPPSQARRVGPRRLRLSVLGQPSLAVAGSLKKKLRDPAFKGARVNVRGKPHRVVVTLRPRRRTEFWLHTLSEPARVVLDIRR